MEEDDKDGYVVDSEIEAFVLSLVSAVSTCTSLVNQ